MDVSAIRTESDLRDLIVAIQPDQCDRIVLPDGSESVHARKGMLAFSWNPEGQLLIAAHQHDTEAEAAACHDATVLNARMRVDFMVAFEQATGASLSAPPDVTGILGA